MSGLLQILILTLAGLGGIVLLALGCAFSNREIRLVLAPAALFFAAACASAEHSAMIADARAIGLVK